MTGANAERGKVLEQAARLALSPPGSPELDVRDTGSTPAGAAAAAQAALAGGDAIIIGPLTAPETAAVANVTRGSGAAVLAFTNDPAQAQPGVWPLGITPAQQVRRLVQASVAQGHSRFAAVLPPTDFGRALGTALSQATSSAGLSSPDIRTHDGTNAGISGTLRDISAYASRRGPIEAQMRKARARRDAEGRRMAAELNKQPIPPAPFDALVLGDTGDKLAWATSFLSYYDIDAPAVRVLGPALWANAASRGGAALNGAWYAAPDPAARMAFDQQYQTKYGMPAPSLADLAFDAASVARVLAGTGGYTIASLTRPDGFAGTDGVFSLQPDGTVRRALAVFEIQRGGPVIVDPAPASVSAPGV